MSGSYSDFGFEYSASPMITGSSSFPGLREFIRGDADDLWERMYVKPKPVIIVCGYCKSHNAITNPTCVQCGAPMGYGVVRAYG